MSLLLSNGRKRRRNKKEAREIQFWDWSYGLDDIQFGHRRKSLKAVDTTGKLDTVLCQHHELVGRNPITITATNAKG